jgi:RNA polymerase sigma-70 factor (ECF subfamily)
VPAVDSSSSALITGVRQRQPEAWARLARLYAPLVYSWARQARLQESDAADVVQQVFQAALTSIDTFDRNQGVLRTWLWGITRNKLRHHFRHQHSNPAAVGGTDAHAAIEQIPEEPFEESTGRINPTSALMQRAIALVEPEFQGATWQAFWRTVIGGESTASVAGELSMTPQAVRQARYRVLKRLRDELQGEL